MRNIINTINLLEEKTQQSMKLNAVSLSISHLSLKSRVLNELDLLYNETTCKSTKLVWV